MALLIVFHLNPIVKIDALTALVLMFFYVFLNKTFMIFFFLNRFVFLFLIFFKHSFAAIAVLLGAVAANGLVWCCVLMWFY